MSEPRRYLVVNEDTKTIVDGPFLWAGDPEWEHPSGAWMIEADAMSEGYTWPPAPEEPPAEEPPADPPVEEPPVEEPPAEPLVEPEK